MWGVQIRSKGQREVVGVFLVQCANAHSCPALLVT